MDKAAIRLRLEDMLASITGRSASFEPELGVCPDLNEYASRVSDQHVLLLLKERDARLLADIAATLDRLGSADFGLCEDCGEPIGMARLLARPTATLCVACQEGRER
ncbi:MAG: TraR/DksA family transcriptional regulator [Desulfovibrionaceae bacterium]